MFYKKLKIDRLGYGAAAVMVVAGLATTVLTTSKVFAAGQLAQRSIRLSSAVAGATSTTYQIAFQPSATGLVKGVVVDFCDAFTTPIIGLSCTSPTGFDITAVVATTNVTVMLDATAVPAAGGPTGGTNDTANWTYTRANAGRTITLTNATGSTMTVSKWFVITINSITNPTDTDTNTAGTQTGTFYGRILTYANNSGANSPATYSAGSEGTYIDGGGIAMSLTSLLTITAKVQEQLTFCIYTSSPGSNFCGTGTGSSINVPTTATTPLSSSTVQTDSSAKFAISTNALNGAVVRMKGYDPSNTSSLRYTLTSGSNVIAPFGASPGNGTCQADSASTSVEQFGMRFSSVGSGLTANATFGCSAGNHGWDGNTNTGTGGNGTANDNITATYGKQVATLAAPTAEVQSTMEFAAKSALTTPAGIYTIGLSFIATGTY
jgi:hypothetical protein